MAKKARKKTPAKRYAKRATKPSRVSISKKAVVVPTSEPRIVSDSLKLATLAQADVRAVEVHFRGCDDDGNFSYRVVGGARQLTEAEEREIEKFLAKHFSCHGECDGSVLIGRLDLQNCLWTGYSGLGGPAERLAELVGDLESHGVHTLVVEVTAGKCSKPKLNPQKSMSASDARYSVDWFLQRIRNYFIEAEGDVPADSEAVALIDQHAWGPSASTLKVDTQTRTLSMSGRNIAKPVNARVDLAKDQKKFCLLD